MLRTLWGCQEGATTTTANSVTAKANACPNTKIAVSGYGRSSAHLAAEQLSPDVQQQVNAALVFGDPLDGTVLSGGIPTKTSCGANAGENAAFIASA
ncbi:hypothetical protein FPV67DRAFT_1671589 [Lyophyllum atratum]|nr:hypothetical protein FPV67DRAFT_1671589 [Lyophyllum atratum]